METDRAVLMQDLMIWARRQPEPGKEIFRPLLHCCLYFDGCSKMTSFGSVRRRKFDKNISHLLLTQRSEGGDNPSRHFVRQSVTENAR